MEFYVYILFSADLDRFYIGHTSDGVEERLKKHLSSHSGFTSRAKDWKIVYSETYPSKAEAYQRELEIKRMKSKKFILNLINKQQ